MGPVSAPKAPRLSCSTGVTGSFLSAPCTHLLVLRKTLALRDARLQAMSHLCVSRTIAITWLPQFLSRACLRCPRYGNVLGLPRLMLPPAPYNRGSPDMAHGFATTPAEVPQGTSGTQVFGALGVSPSRDQSGPPKCTCSALPCTCGNHVAP